MVHLSAQSNLSDNRWSVHDLGRMHGVAIQVMETRTPWLGGPDTIVFSAGPLGGFGLLGHAVTAAYPLVDWERLELHGLARTPLVVDLPAHPDPRATARRVVLVSVHDHQGSVEEGPPTLDGVRRATVNGLTAALRQGARRVALPLLGAGALGMAADDVAAAVMRAVDTVLRHVGHPEAIMVLCQTPAHRSAVANAWDDHELLGEAKLRALNDVTLREQSLAGGADLADLAAALDVPDEELWEPCASGRAEMRALPDPDAARLTMRQRLVDLAMMPRLRLAIEGRRQGRARADLQFRRAEFRRPLTGVDSRGLRQAAAERAVITTAARDELLDLLDSDRSARASVGVAGARGCGKSTLLGDAYARWGTRGVRILLPAPASYSPREFLLHLYARVCAEVMDRDTEDLTAGRPSADAVTRRSWDLLALIVVPLLVTLIGAVVAVTASVRALPADPARLAALGGTLAATVWVPLLLTGVPRSWWDTVWRVPGAGRLLFTTGVCGAIVVSAPFGLLEPRQLGGAVLLVFSAGTCVWVPGPLRRRPAPAATGASGAVRRMTAVVGTAAVNLTTALIGVLMLTLPAAVPVPGVPVLLGAVLAAAGGAALWAGSGWYRDVQPHRPPGPPGDGASRRAARELARIRHQTTVVSGWSGAVKVAPSWLPVGVDLGATGSSSEATLPLGVPDLVEGIKRLLPSRGPALVAIDELDKIESVERARDFLNEIKGILDADRCFFLISMSEDAIGSFERRGLPFRDVFDSAFDEVVRAPHLSAAESSELLSSRITGAPPPYAALAHCQSGGLPRDLLRAAGRMLALAADDRARLSTVADRVVHRDLLGKADAVIAAITAITLEPAVSAVLRVLRDLDTCGRGDRARCLLGDGWLTHAEALPTIAAEAADDVPRRRELSRLTAELLGYAYYCRTLLELFRAGTDEETDTLIRLVHGDGGRLLDQLAQVRQTFLVNPYVAWELLSETRADARLPVFALPAPVRGAAGAGVAEHPA